MILFGCTANSSVSEKIPLIFFSQAAPGKNETALAYSGVWEPEQGVFKLNPNPSFELVKPPGQSMNIKELGLHWRGDQQIVFSPAPGEPEMQVNFKNMNNDFEIITSRIKAPAHALSPLYYAGQNKEYLACGQENKIILLESQGDKTTKKTFAAPENGGEAIPVLLGLKDQEPVLLVVVSSPAMPEKLYLLTISGKNGTWTLVDKAGPRCSYTAGSGIKAAVLNSRVYMSDPCGEGVLAFNLEEKIPAPVPVEAINRELKLAAEDNPSETQVAPRFGVYNDILLVNAVTGGAQGKDNIVEWVWAFREEKLLGKIAVEHAGEKVIVYSNGKEVDSKNLPGIKGVLFLQSIAPAIPGV